MNDPREHRMHGFTLVEVMISLVILVPTLVVIFAMHPAIAKSFTTNLGAASSDQRSAANLDRACALLRGASISSLEVWDGTNWITPSDGIDYEGIRFRALERLPNDGAPPALGPVRTLQFQLVATETRNGVDDNGNRLVDEGVLLFVDPAGIRTVIATDLERFVVSRQNRQLVVQLSLATRDQTGAVHRRTRRIDVLLRNN